MYYITNHKNQVIAADSSLLKHLGLQDVEELYKKSLLEELTFTSLTPDNVTITLDDQEYTFALESHALSSMVGDLTLNTLQSADILEDEAGAMKGLIGEEISEAAEESALSLDDELFSIGDMEETSTEEPLQTSEILLEDDQLISIIEDEPLFDTKEPEKEITVSEEEDLLELTSDEELISIMDEEETQTVELSSLEPMGILEDELEDTLALPEESLEETEEKVSTEETSMAPIYVDASTISQTIGVTQDEYNKFLNEYIDTAIALEKDLKSSDKEVQTTAINTLVQLSEVLHLPEISDTAKAIDTCPAEESDACIESLYNKLARLTTQESLLSETKEEETAFTESGIQLEEDLILAPEMEFEEEKSLEEGFGTISLDDVKPIHFDFRLEEAAGELSLPVELIEEFVNDFIDQANSETTNMLAAYEKGDLDRIQKIGHLLKGAASNLRINPLADTLYEIQFCEDSTKLEGLIKNYWAHFIAFEKQMELTSK